VPNSIERRNPDRSSIASTFVPAIRYRDLASRDAGEPSEPVHQRVNSVRDVQLRRFQKITVHANAQMGARDIKSMGREES
jgi:predicted ATPase with chaperone activity